MGTPKLPSVKITKAKHGENEMSSSEEASRSDMESVNFLELKSQQISHSFSEPVLSRQYFINIRLSVKQLRNAFYFLAT